MAGDVFLSGSTLVDAKGERLNLEGQPGVPDGGTYIDTAANLASSNPVLDAGDYGYATDNHVLKVGDGETAWNDLPRVGSGYTLDSNTLTDTVGPTSGTTPLEIGALQLDWESDGIREQEVGVTVPSAIGSVVGAICRIYFEVDETLAQLTQVPVDESGGIDYASPAPLHLRKVFTEGAHTAKVFIQRVNGTGTLTVNANALFPAQSWVDQR